jgi:hypothetical protein
MNAARGTAAVPAPSPATPRWATACTWIEGYLLDNRHAPSVREVAEALGLASTGSAWFTLQRMQAAGLVAWRIGPGGSASPRTLHVTAAGRRLIGGRARQLAELRIAAAADRLEGA